MSTMDISKLNEHAMKLFEATRAMMSEAVDLNAAASKMLKTTVAAGTDPFMMALTVFVLACFIGYYVVWKVTPALHSPLMAVTNAISSVIIVGAIMSLSREATVTTLVCGFIAILLASINIFGGFMVTKRMLAMFSSKNKKSSQQ